MWPVLGFLNFPTPLSPFRRDGDGQKIVMVNDGKTIATVEQFPW